MTDIERATADLTQRFARDLLELWRRASLEELQALVERAPKSHTKRRPKAHTTGEVMHDWRTRYGLTEVETAILLAALEGKRREEIARERRVAVVTVKSQISTLLKKTGDRSLLAATTRLLRER